MMASAISSKSSEANFLLSPFSKSVNYEQDARALFTFDNKLNNLARSRIHKGAKKKNGNGIFKYFKG